MRILGGGLQGLAVSLVMLVRIYVPVFGTSLIITKRRLNDLNHSGWWSLLLFVPFVNIIVGLYLTFGSGTDGPNDYGLPPAKNSPLLLIGGLLLPIVFIGILAAVALPAYQKYLMRAEAAKLQQQIQQQGEEEQLQRP